MWECNDGLDENFWGFYKKRKYGNDVIILILGVNCDIKVI